MIENKGVPIEINTLEEFTTHCLDRSLEGLEELRRNSITCGERMNENDPQAFVQFAELCQNLYDFYVFEGDVRTVFMLDTEQLQDRRGTLKQTENDFEKMLESMPGMMESQAVSDLADSLKNALPRIIDRFQDLLPTLRNYIEDEYINYQE